MTRKTRFICNFCGYRLVRSRIWEGDCPRCGHGCWTLEDLPQQMEFGDLEKIAKVKGQVNDEI